jgi:hypothetical protein
MIDDVRWGLALVAGAGVVMNVIMLYRLNRDVRDARRLGLLDDERATALSARRRQSMALLIISVCLAGSALADAGTGLARLFVFIAALTVDWKSWLVFGDRFTADVMVSERLRRQHEREQDRT